MFYVRALFKYQALQPDEVSLHVNDILAVTEVIDDNWYAGYSYKCTGNFPISYVETINLPSCRDNEKLFAAKRNFEGQENGDLSFAKGDIIIGLNCIDKNWWNGYVIDNKDEKGIFPLTHVFELKVFSDTDKKTNDLAPNLGKNFKNPQKDRSCDVADVVGSKYHQSRSKIRKFAERNGAWYTLVNTKSRESFVTPYAKTLYPYEGVNADELSFLDNEIVYLTKHYSGGWSLGEIDGKSGLFPTSYVEIIVDCIPSLQDIKPSEQEEQDSANTQSDQNPDCYEELDDYANIAENFKESHVLTNVGTIGESDVNNNLNMKEHGTLHDELYGRALYDFSKSSEHEIDLQEGDTVTILRKMNADWYEVRHDDGRCGYCPVAYVEVFGKEPDCAMSFSFQDTTLKHASKQMLHENIGQLSSSSSSYQNFHDIQLSQQDKLLNYLSPGIRPNQKDNCDAMDDGLADHHCPSQLSAVRAKPRKTLQAIITKSNSMLTSSLSTATSSLLAPFRNAPSRPISLLKDELKIAQSVSSRNSKQASTILATPYSSRLAKEGFTYLSPNTPTSPTKLPSSSITNVIGDSVNKHNSLKVSDGKPQKTSIKVINEKEKSMSSVKNAQELEEIITAKAEKRLNVMNELETTELDYVMCLELCYNLFHDKDAYDCPTNLDVDALFGNMLQIINLSKNFHKMLKECSQVISSTQKSVGSCFLELENDFKRVYTQYCRNHDNVIALLEKYDVDEECQNFMQRMMQKMKSKMVVFDLGSILIKPVQRILKYPLLLSELDKCTDESSNEKKEIQMALNCMADIASYINESKRRQDLVLKYKHESENKLSDKLGKLSMHSTKKKLMRFSQMIVGIQTVDEKFNKEEVMFKAVDETIKSFLKDLHISLSLTEDTTSLYEELGRGVEMYCDNFLVDDMFIRISQKISPKNFREFKEKVESVITPALTNLLQTFRGPSKIIRKRHDKLLDYDNVNARLKSLSDINSSIDNALKEELKVAKATYEALNLQMLDELPKLTSLARHVLHVCIIYYLQCKQILLNQTIKEIKQLVVFKGNSTAPVSSSADTTLTPGEHFNIEHALAVDKLSHFSFIPSCFNPSLSTVRKGKDRDLDLCTISPSSSNFTGFDGADRVYAVAEPYLLLDLETDSKSNEKSIASGVEGHQLVLEKYSTDQVYRVKENFKGSLTMDINLMEDAIVGVIKRADPMGNKERWFVDDGNRKGFILKSYLAPYQDDFRKSFPTLHRLEQLDGEKNKKLHPQDFQKQQKVWQAERRSLNLSSPPSMDDLNESFHSAVSSFDVPQKADDHVQPLISALLPPPPSKQRSSSPPCRLFCQPSHILTAQTQQIKPPQASSAFLTVTSSQHHNSPTPILSSQLTLPGPPQQFKSSSLSSSTPSPYHRNSTFLEVANLDNKMDILMPSNLSNPYYPSPLSSSSLTVTTSNSLPQVPPADVTHSSNSQWHLMAVAQYNFAARSDIELSITKGKIYTVLRTCDLDGNGEWCLLKELNDGRGNGAKIKCGYVPTNYISILK